MTEGLHNGRNQLTQVDFGNGLETTYAYHGTGCNFHLQGISVGVGDDAHKRYQREIQIALRLCHLNLVELINHGSAGKAFL